MVPNTACRKSSAVQKWAKLLGFLCDRPIYTIYLANFIKQLIRFRPNWRCTKFMPCGNTTHQVSVDEKRFLLWNSLFIQIFSSPMITTATVASELWGQGGTLYPPSSGLVPPSQRCGLCQKFKQTTLTTRLYKVRTNLYPPHLRKRSDAPGRQPGKTVNANQQNPHRHCMFVGTEKRKGLISCVSNFL